MFSKNKVVSYGSMSAEGYVFVPKNYDDVAECLAKARKNNLSVCAFGTSRSFSNVSLLSDQIMLDTSKMDKVIDFDVHNQTMTVQAGTRLTTVLKLALPHNFTLVALSGSMRSTVAGSISSDVLGMDSWKTGSFSENVERMLVMVTSGERLWVSREEHQDLFHAIVGGMGLIAVVLEVVLRLQKIKSYHVEVNKSIGKNLEGIVEKFENLNELHHHFAHIWIQPDTFLNGKARGLFRQAVFVDKTVDYNKKEIPRLLRPRAHILGLNTKVFWFLARNLYIPKVYQGIVKGQQLIRSIYKTEVTPYPIFQYPVIRYMPNWNLFFRPRGFRDMNFLIPTENLREAYLSFGRILNQHHVKPVIVELRKSREGEGYLSFGGKGYSLSILFGLRGLNNDKIQKLEEELIEACLQFQGKIHLSKFPLVSLETALEMFPKFDRFLAVKRKWDPNNYLWSDAADYLIAHDERHTF
jgi:decaprenylphospho-beta-D-ribofuranose 2-oxidase